MRELRAAVGPHEVAVVPHGISLLFNHGNVFKCRDVKKFCKGAKWACKATPWRCKTGKCRYPAGTLSGATAVACYGGGLWLKAARSYRTYKPYRTCIPDAGGSPCSGTGQDARRDRGGTPVLPVGGDIPATLSSHPGRAVPGGASFAFFLEVSTVPGKNLRRLCKKMSNFPGAVT